MEHVHKGNINAAMFNALKQRMSEIGAQDLDEPESGKKPTKEDRSKPIRKLLDKSVNPAKTANKPRVAATE